MRRPEEREPAFTLPPGATGFHRPQDGPLPETGLPAFRTALYAAARAAGGSVGEVEARAYPRTFHTASVAGRAGESFVLCHAHHPWIAFAAERRDWYRDEFLAPPPWSRAFAASGFTVLSGETLATPLSGVDTSALSPGERRQVRSYAIDTLGGLLFNAWD
ncbi:hypothetical protein [Streptomyces sp. NBC_00091]|uniref:hypothetical protein n=1 Tax=Streptomyces sp. NBC_00091 TaxID=2975648 RepID=UPI00225AB78D|nr:hypothetical protein [Streptomyces sp. NBC_00091]MCX5375703.1 hypothetical protein [Streptomyces sp. NBC_00091]